MNNVKTGVFEKTRKIDETLIRLYSQILENYCLGQEIHSKINIIA